MGGDVVVTKVLEVKQDQRRPEPFIELVDCLLKFRRVDVWRFVDIAARQISEVMTS